MNEGYIKFSCIKNGNSIQKIPAQFHEFNQLRTYCHSLTLIGMHENGIGYGNISLRINGGGTFIVSGTQTGDRKTLSVREYCEILSFDSRHNEVIYNGELEPSSESMSHGSVYKANSTIQTVVHLHDECLFDYLKINGYPNTPPEASFGTARLADEIEMLVKKSKTATGIFYTAGHVDGIIAYSDSIETAKQLITDVYEQSIESIVKDN